MSGKNKYKIVAMTLNIWQKVHAVYRAYCKAWQYSVLLWECFSSVGSGTHVWIDGKMDGVYPAGLCKNDEGEKIHISTSPEVHH